MFLFSSATFDFKVLRFGTQSYLFKLKRYKLLSRIGLKKVVLKI